MSSRNTSPISQRKMRFSQITMQTPAKDTAAAAKEKSV